MPLDNAFPPPEGIIEYQISLIWLFVFVFTVLMLFLWYFFLAKRSAEQRELQSFEFSHLIIEGMETERHRISCEFHDTILPLVRDTKVQDMIRSICMELMPPDFNRLPIKAALVNSCEAFTRRSGIKCACSIEEGIDFSSLGAVNQLHIYRIIQESLTNIEKHSQAEKAALVIRKTSSVSGRVPDKNILICVSDDGTGLQPRHSPKPGEGMGMKSMSYRAGILGAKIDFIGESGDGLMVRIEIPLLSAGESNAK